MGTSHRHVAAMIAVLALCGCTAAPGPGQTQAPGQTPSGGPSMSPGRPTSGPTPLPSTGQPAPTGGATSATPAESTDPTPLPKVQRSGSATLPTESAAPAGTTDQVVYSDGVTLRIVDIEFGKETQEGPGRFPGREFAILELEIGNKGTTSIDLDTTVVTVLDASDQQIAPVYVEEADVSDFSGKVEAGSKAVARYAFAVPEASRSQVTVVVDFDSVHTSAVFHGELS